MECRKCEKFYRALNPSQYFKTDVEEIYIFVCPFCHAINVIIQDIVVQEVEY